MNPKFVTKEFDRAESRPHLMVIDDNLDILNVSRAILTRIADAPVECFSSPYEALAAFQAAPGKYSLVITDFEMPGMTGAELCGHLLRISPGLRVVLATGSSIASDPSVKTMGFRGLLRKPFMIADLKNTLAEAGVLLSEHSSNLMMA
jgi:CheY-like chemotaxis protein